MLGRVPLLERIDLCQNVITALFIVWKQISEKAGKGGEPMFSNIFSENLSVLRDSCCSCTCKCGCEPTSAESSVRSGGSGSGAANASKNASNTSS